MTRPETTQRAATAKRQRVISGMRPTGKLHIGNYFGAFANWLKLQADDSNDCYFFVADWHSLTSDYADTSQIAQNSIEIATDFLASGLDPNKSTIFQQSQVPEHAELDLLLSMVTPLGWLERVPTYKEALENIEGKDLHTYGFLGYPVLQTADIVIYGEPGLPLVVPVGEDQVAHVELGREIVRKFNFHFGLTIDTVAMTAPENLTAVDALATSLMGKPGGYLVKSAFSREDAEVISQKLRTRMMESGIHNSMEWMEKNFTADNLVVRKFVRIREWLVPPGEQLTQTPRIPGTDGRKMSKSYNNFIALGESDESIRKKTKTMLTDPARKLRTDPGDPDVCPVFSWHKLFSDGGRAASHSARLHDGRDRLRGLQADHGRRPDKMDRTGARAPEGIRIEAGRSAGDSGRRIEESSHRRASNYGAGARGCLRLGQIASGHQRWRGSAA